MVQTRSSPEKLRIVLTPMRIPESVPQAGLDLAGPEGITKVAGFGPSLLLHPGEPSEMIVQVQNLERHIIQIDLRIEGDFPTKWCQVRTEGNELAPGAQMDAVLYFTVPDTFFEDQEALGQGRKERLELKGQPELPPAAALSKLNFQSRICVYINPGTAQEQIQEAEFSLYIRPYSAYMEFLPVLYREVDFISRFIKIFEQAFEPVIQSYNVMWANLDPLTAPQALLPFLAHWVAWPVDSIWNLSQQRRLIRRAVELYLWRGTRKGLRLYLHFYTNLPLDEISITEPFGQGFIIGTANLGEGAVLGGGQPYHFVVRLHPDRSHNIDEQFVRRIIDQEKPAFSTYDLFIDANA